MSHLHKQGGKYSYQYMQALLARVRIQEVIGNFVELRRLNERYAYGLCPFHQEQSPSFTISEEGRFYHCFGCGSHGDVVQFLVHYHSLHVSEMRVRKELRRRGKDFWQVSEIAERYARRFLADKKEFRYLDAIVYLAKRYRYWPSQHIRLIKRLKKI